MSSGAASLISVCTDPRNNGLSIWLIENHALTHVCSQPKGIPKFNSNNTYVLVNQRMELSIAGDKPVNQYKIFFWIGCHTNDYDNNFEMTISFLQELGKKGPHIKIRYFIEFQYAESPTFFTLFKR
jgi:hypothetical protein